MFSWERPYRNFTFYYNWVKFTKKILFLKIRSILEILYDFENLRKFWPFLLKTLQFSQYLIKNFQIFCGSSLTHRKYFHQISLNLEHMEIYAAVHFTVKIPILSASHPLPSPSPSRPPTVPVPSSTVSNRPKPSQTVPHLPSPSLTVLQC